MLALPVPATPPSRPDAPTSASVLGERRVRRFRRRRWSMAAVGAALGVGRAGLWALMILGWLIVTAFLVVLCSLLFITWLADHGMLPQGPPA